mgnify:CR=1 FL=1
MFAIKHREVGRLDGSENANNVPVNARVRASASGTRMYLDGGERPAGSDWLSDWYDAGPQSNSLVTSSKTKNVATILADGTTSRAAAYQVTVTVTVSSMTATVRANLNWNGAGADPGEANVETRIVKLGNDNDDAWALTML